MLFTLYELLEKGMIATGADKSYIVLRTRECLEIYEELNTGQYTKIRDKLVYNTTEQEEAFTRFVRTAEMFLENEGLK